MGLLSSLVSGFTGSIGNGLSFIDQTNSFLTQTENLISLTPSEATPPNIPSVITYDPSNPADVQSHSYPRSVVQIGSPKTGGVVNLPFTSWDITLAQYGRPSEATIETSLSRLPFDILRKTSEGLTVSQLPVDSSIQTPLQPLSGVTGQTPSFVPIKIYAGYLSQDQVLNFDPLAGYPGGTTDGMVVVFDGIVESVHGSLKDDALTITATDRSKILMETRLNVNIINKSPAQIATILANAVGLTPVVDNNGLASQPTGYYYKELKTTTRRAIRAWDLLVDIGRRIGYDVFVLGTKLYFIQTKAASYLPTLYLTWGKNLINLEFDRDLFHSNDFKVVVYGYVPKTAKSSKTEVNVLGESIDTSGISSLITLPSSSQLKPGVYLSSSGGVFGNEGKPVYVFMDRNANTPAQLKNAAEAIAFDIARHQFHVDLYTIGMPEVATARIAVQVKIPRDTAPGNFGKTSEMFISGKTLYPLEINHSFKNHSGEGGGWTMHIMAAYLPPPPISGSTGLPSATKSLYGYASWVASV